MNAIQNQHASTFRALHAKGHLLVLPNAWDAGSARVIEEAGAPAIATSSAALSWAHGFPDGQALSPKLLLATVEEIVRAVKVPVSVDSEAGFSENPDEAAQFVMELARLGAVGINLEDGSSTPQITGEKIVAIRKAASREGVDVFINARIDVYLRKLTAPEQALEETLVRLKRYENCGADGIFVPGVVDVSILREIISKTALAVNALIFPGLPPVVELKAIGIRRVSAGAGIGRAALGAARRAAKDLLERGSYETMFAESAGLAQNVNALFAR